MTTRVVFPGLVQTALERIYQSDSTALGLNSTTQAAGGSYLRLSVETGDCRITMGGLAASLTPTTGILLQQDTVYEIDNFGSTGFLVIHGTGVAATVVNVERYKWEGEGVS